MPDGGAGPERECRPADGGAFHSSTCALGEAWGSSGCPLTAGGGEGVWDPRQAVAVEIGWLEAGRNFLSVQFWLMIYLDSVQKEDMCGHCPVIPQAQQGTPSQPTASCTVMTGPHGPQSRSPSLDPQSRVRGPGWGQGLLSGGTEDCAGRCFTCVGPVGEQVGQAESRQEQCRQVGGAQVTQTGWW